LNIQLFYSKTEEPKYDRTECLPLDVKRWSNCQYDLREIWEELCKKNDLFAENLKYDLVKCRIFYEDIIKGNRNEPWNYEPKFVFVPEDQVLRLYVCHGLDEINEEQSSDPLSLLQHAETIEIDEEQKIHKRPKNSKVGTIWGAVERWRFCVKNGGSFDFPFEGIPKSTMYEYWKEIREAQSYRYDFEENFEEEISHLRAFIRHADASQ